MHLAKAVYLYRKELALKFKECKRIHRIHVAEAQKILPPKKFLIVKKAYSQALQNLSEKFQKDIEKFAESLVIGEVMAMMAEQVGATEEEKIKETLSMGGIPYPITESTLDIIEGLNYGN